MEQTPATLVTGANRGIGRALVGRMAERGPVIGTHRGIEPSPVQNVLWRPLDVTDPHSLTAMAAELGEQHLPLLVCNAGVYLDKGQALSTGYPPEMWAQSFAANVTGVFMTVQALLPALRAQPGAKIAIISSQMASDERAPGGSYAYRASKAAVLNLGRNLAADLRPEGIAVGIYHPGWVQTDMGGNAADITVDQAAEGLVARFDDLSMETTGSFLTWDGQTHPF